MMRYFFCFLGWHIWDYQMHEFFTDEPNKFETKETKTCRVCGMLRNA